MSGRLVSTRLTTIALAAGALASCGSGTGTTGRASSSPPPPASRPAPAPAHTSALARHPGGPLVATIATGLDVPWEIAFLPDGRALITERPGRVRLLGRDHRLAPGTVAAVPVSAQGEGGLLGLAVDPQFTTNRFVYLYRTTAAGNVVTRYRMVGNRLTPQATIVRGIRAGFVHDGGRIHFGPDRRLYISTGETGDGPLAQQRSSLNGKFLRLGPAGYHATHAVRPEVFSLGHRNPQGFDWQPGTGRLVATEHGPSGGDGPDGFDEVNLIHQAGNYGWPVVFGTGRRAGLIPPVVLYRTAIAPSGATFVSKPGSSWTGDFIFGALIGEQVRRVCFAGARVTCNQELWRGRFGRMRTVVEGPDGALYALTNNRDGRGTPRPGDDRVLRIVPPAG